LIEVCIIKDQEWAVSSQFKGNFLQTI